jgi:hypothetical protein
MARLATALFLFALFGVCVAQKQITVEIPDLGSMTGLQFDTHKAFLVRTSFLQFY